jgi:acetate kinase
MARVLVVNSGSSSIKYQLIETGGPTRLAHGLVERIGAIGSVPDHDAGLRAVVAALERAGLSTGITAIGHRVVHGGDRFIEPTLIDDRVLDEIREQVPLAPLHNPANLTGILIARQLWPEIPQVAVFDTAFHATLPPHAYRYAVPETWYTSHRVRRYGFHGTSHAYVARQAASILGRPLEQLRMITAHLGNGASMTAIAGGRSVDTSMGFTPLEGLVMGTRSGDIDPAIGFHIARNAGLTIDEIDVALNSASGLRGLCGDNDLRVIEARAEQGDAAAQLALDVFCHRIRKYIGAYAAVLGGLDALVFTAGIGEHSAAVRQRVCTGLEFLGIDLDPVANAASARLIGATGCEVAVLVVPTDEELEIAVQTLATVSA